MLRRCCYLLIYGKRNNAEHTESQELIGTLLRIDDLLQLLVQPSLIGSLLQMPLQPLLLLLEVPLLMIQPLLLSLELLLQNITLLLHLVLLVHLQQGVPNELVKQHLQHLRLQMLLRLISHLLIKQLQILLPHLLHLLLELLLLIIQLLLLLVHVLLQIIKLLLHLLLRVA
jgi:hypothetical protein